MASFSRSISRRLHCVNKWFQSEQSVTARMVLFGSTVVIYPIGLVIFNGPLLKFTFPWRNSVDHQLPEHVKRAINEQYKLWLAREDRLEKDAFVKFSCRTDAKSLDTTATGSMSVRFGAQIALPFYVRFKTVEEALDYCKTHLEPFYFRNKLPLCIIWESDLGKELLNTFILSDKALNFLIARDLCANDGYNAFANNAITWATWTIFASFFTYWAHKRFTKGTFTSFVILYTVFLVVTVYAANEWHNLYRHMNACHADKVSAKLSMEHSEGGKEYYLKIMERNRILRTLLGASGAKLISVVGDEQDAVTPYFLRYELLKDISIEDDEIRPTLAGDDF